MSIRQLATTTVVDAETGHDAVDYKEAVFVAGKGGSERIQKLELVLSWERKVSKVLLHRKMEERGRRRDVVCADLAVEGTGISNIFLGQIRIH